MGQSAPGLKHISALLREKAEEKEGGSGGEGTQFDY